MRPISSLLDTDLYKFTMGQAVLHHFPGTKVEYTFRCRDENVDLTKYETQIKTQIREFCSLTLSNEELFYLASLPYIKSDYVDFMELYHPNLNHIEIESTNKKLDIRVRGSWFLTIYFEVPILAMISEIFSQNECPNPDFQGARERLRMKKELMNANSEYFKFADFGTRRRFSHHWQDEVLGYLSDLYPKNLVGTSNVFFAKKYGMRPIGTMAHEWLQCGQAVGVRLVDSQRHMLQKWVEEYRGNLGIALSDVIGIDAFLDDFDAYFAKLYDGIRQDSGDPFEVGEKIVSHYKNLGINPLTKTLIFSDALSFDKGLNLIKHFKDKINVLLGIGTNLTNDIPSFTPLNIVLKVTRCNNEPVAKISDSEGKSMCNDISYLRYLQFVFDQRHEMLKRQGGKR